MLTLLVIPASYTIFDDFSLLLGRGARWVQRKFGQAPNEEPVAQPALLPELEEPAQPGT